MQDATSPHGIAKVGIDDYHQAIILLLCRRHRARKSVCSLGNLLQGWRELCKDDAKATQAYLTQLKKAVLDVESDVEDGQEQQKKVAG